MSKRITVKQLIAAGAKEDCKHLALFADEWPSGMSVTLGNCKRAVELGLDVNWAAEHLLSSPAWKAYDEARAPALKSYNEATAPARKSYNEARATARKAYDEATAPAWKAYKEARATAFCRAYNSDG